MESFGRYQLLTCLARGGMAEVFLARQSGEGRFERLVVVKRILPNLVEDPRFIDLFLEEARLAALLDHPNVVAIYDFGRVGDAYFLAMPYVHGLSVQRLLRDAVRQGLKLPIDVSCEIALQTLDGLHYAHERQGLDGQPLGLVHRDISPSNLMIDDSGRTLVLDFGIATASDSATSDSGTLRGKLAYMSPEQTRGDVDLDRRSDLFSLGIVLFEMLTMRRLFKRRGDLDVVKAIIEEPIPDPCMLRPELPKALGELLLRCLERDQRSRPATALELREALLEAARGAGIQPEQSKVRRYLQRHFHEQLRERALQVQGAVQASDEDLPTRVTDLPAIPPTPRRRFLMRSLLVLGGLLAVGAPTAYLLRRTRSRPEGKPLRFGITPFLPEQVMRHDLTPLLRAVEQRLGRRIELTVAESYRHAIDQLLSGQLDVVDLPAYPFLLARRREPKLQLIVTPVTHRTRTYESYVLVLRDSGLRTLAQLRGRRVCFVDRRSTSGFLLPRVMVRKAGFDPDKFFGQVQFSGNHLRAVRDLVAGRCDAAAVTSQAYLSARDNNIPIARVRILQVSDPVPHGVYCALPSFDRKLAGRLRDVLLAMDLQKTLGRPLLSKAMPISGYAPVDEKAFADLQHEVDLIK